MIFCVKLYLRSYLLKNKYSLNFRISKYFTSMIFKYYLKIFVI
jgi:hypothetical protein